MNAPHKPCVAIHDFTSDGGSHEPDFSAYVSWADRLAAFRTTDHLDGCLYSIRSEAEKSDNLDWFWACQAALDNGGDLTELDELIAQEAEAEHRQSVAYRFETRTGRDWPGDCYFDQLSKGQRAFNREIRRG